MNIDKIPFNRLIGLRREPEGGEFLVGLPAGTQYHNHLGTIHAAAQLALAEAASGYHLIRNYRALDTTHMAVVRRVEAQFIRPANGAIRAKVTVADEMRRRFERCLDTKRVIPFELGVDVFDESGEHSLAATITWIIARREEG